MLKIDIHTHILPPELPAFRERFGYGGFMRLVPCSGSSDREMVSDSGVFFRRVQNNCFDPEARLQEYAAFGVQVQVLSTVPVMFSYWAKPQDGLAVAQFLNDHLAQVVQSQPSRFVGLGTVPLQDPKLAVREAERCLRLGLRGFQIGSHVNEWNLSDPALFEFFEACEALGAPLFVHPWEMMGRERMPKYWLPWLVGMPAETALAICSCIFGGVFARFPKLRIAFAHGGGAYPFIAGRVQHGFDCRPDLCAIDCKVPPDAYRGHFFVDSLVHDPRALGYLLETLPDRVCLGTDYPFPLGEARPGECIDRLRLTEPQRAQLYHGAALEWLGMERREAEREFGA